MGEWQQRTRPSLGDLSAEKSKEEIQQANTADFQQSEDSAELAALHFLGKPVALTVSKVTPDGPAAGALQEGDVLVKIGDTPVTTITGVQDTVGAIAPGTAIDVTVLREGVETVVPVTVGARPNKPESGYLGVTPSEVPDVPFTVQFNLADIGGPSAGLMFTLALVDKLTPGGAQRRKVRSRNGHHRLRRRGRSDRRHQVQVDRRVRSRC